MHIFPLNKLLDQAFNVRRCRRQPEPIESASSARTRRNAALTGVQTQQNPLAVSHRCASALPAFFFAGAVRTACVTVGRPSCLPLPAFGRHVHAAAAGLLLWARRAGDVDRCMAGGQQQARRSTAHSGKCGQYHVVGRRRKLNRDLAQPQAGGCMVRIRAGSR